MAMFRDDDSLDVCVRENWIGSEHVPCLKKPRQSHVRLNQCSGSYDEREIVRNSPESDSAQMKQYEGAD